jgi:hypothetical protein
LQPEDSKVMPSRLSGGIPAFRTVCGGLLDQVRNLAVDLIKLSGTIDSAVQAQEGYRKLHRNCRHLHDRPGRLHVLRPLMLRTPGQPGRMQKHR